MWTLVTFNDLWDMGNMYFQDINILETFERLFWNKKGKLERIIYKQRDILQKNSLC